MTRRWFSGPRLQHLHTTNGDGPAAWFPTDRGEDMPKIHALHDTRQQPDWASLQLGLVQSKFYQGHGSNTIVFSMFACYKVFVEFEA